MTNSYVERRRGPDPPSEGHHVEVRTNRQGAGSRSGAARRGSTRSGNGNTGSGHRPKVEKEEGETSRRTTTGDTIPSAVTHTNTVEKPSAPKPQQTALLKLEQHPLYHSAYEEFRKSITDLLERYPREIIKRVVGKANAEFDRWFPPPSPLSEAGRRQADLWAMANAPRLPDGGVAADDLVRDRWNRNECARCGASLEAHRSARAGYGPECRRFVPRKDWGSPGGYREEMGIRWWVENVTLEERLIDGGMRL